MQEENHIFQGLRRDNHQIKQPGEFLWNAHNIRLTNRDESTLLSITNERGPAPTSIEFEGKYVGHCVVGKYLIVFTAGSTSSHSIYRIETSDSEFNKVLLFHNDKEWKEGWSADFPIEAVGIYETELVQKVYWVDGNNQPRVINVTKPELKKEAPSSDYSYLYDKSEFDFVQTIDLKGKVEVEKIYGDGEFPAGVIQYVFTYYNKYSQESKVWYTTPLYYTSFNDRGGSGEDKVSNSFKLTIVNPDKSFEFVRVYSIQRTSINGTPTIKRVRDIPIGTDTVNSNGEPIISVIDTGTIGDIVDSTELLFLGGTALVAGCITHKDGTLFLGNITLKEGEHQKGVEEILSKATLVDGVVDTNTFTLNEDNVYYSYKPDLSGPNAARFKTNETYRLGIQAQFSDGSWSEPVYLGDKIVVSKNPWDERPGERTTKSVSLPKNAVESLVNLYGVRKLRTCVVFPAVHERDIVCQGVLCPTVYSIMGRRNNSPYAMSSWFFRAATKGGSNNNLLLDSDSKLQNTYTGAVIQFRHDKALFSGNNPGAEVQSMIPDGDITDVSRITRSNVDKYNSHFFVDENIITLHSPDIEFDTASYHIDYNNIRLNIIGVAKLGAISGDINIQAGTAAGDSGGFVHNRVGYRTGEDSIINGGLVMGNFYKDASIKDDYSTSTEQYWPVYPWSRVGSLNNDPSRPSDKGQRTAELVKKTISNLKFFSENCSITGSPLAYNVRSPQLFSSNEVSLIKLSPPYLGKEISYLGNIETMITSGGEYPLYSATAFAKPAEKVDSSLFNESKDPVSIKYKSTPHIVFSLEGRGNSTLQLLPRSSSIKEEESDNYYRPPEWLDDGKGDAVGVHDGVLSHYHLTVDIGHTHDGPNGTYFIREDWRLGKYEEFSTGKERTLLDKSQAEGIILKITSGTTVILIDDNHGYDTEAVPGTTADDYRPIQEGDWNEDKIGTNYRMYIGKDRYYKVHFTDNIHVELVETTVDNQEGEGDEEGSSERIPVIRDTFNIDDSSLDNHSYLLIGELIRTVDPETKFGGNSKEALRQNTWIPSCKPIDISDLEAVNVPFVYGDTWYARYDCLKTYPFTKEDNNQIVEIGSFMCETRVNIDGRHDRNRGQMSNLSMSPENFNIMNEVYSQHDNYFTYKILDEDYYKNNKFSHQVIWSTEKHAGSDIDQWTHMTVATPLDMDGEKGPVTKLAVLNDTLLCLQERAFSTIQFNSRVQIPTSDGVPIEITNGYKVDGYKFINNSIGCQNKWSVCNTLKGLYFIDDNTDTLWVFNGQLANLSESLGMKWWFQNNHSSVPWKPTVLRKNGIRTFYDPTYGDIYFTPGPEHRADLSGITDTTRDALCYSEQLGQFVSQYSYGGVQAMLPFEEKFLSLRDSNSAGLKLWENFKGSYNDFYGAVKGWDFSFISNDNPTITKIFDTIEIRTDKYWTYGTVGLVNTCPFNFIEASNEYQKGSSIIDERNMRKKFRVWRGLIPRNNGTRQRIRNLWSMITLGWNPANDTFVNPGQDSYKAVIHDVSVKYTI